MQSGRCNHKERDRQRDGHSAYLKVSYLISPLSHWLSLAAGLRLSRQPVGVVRACFHACLFSNNSTFQHHASPLLSAIIDPGKFVATFHLERPFGTKMNNRLLITYVSISRIALELANNLRLGLMVDHNEQFLVTNLSSNRCRFSSIICHV